MLYLAVEKCIKSTPSFLQSYPILANIPPPHTHTEIIVTNCIQVRSFIVYSGWQNFLVRHLIFVLLMLVKIFSRCIM